MAKSKDKRPKQLEFNPIVWDDEADILTEDEQPEEAPIETKAEVLPETSKVTPEFLSDTTEEESPLAGLQRKNKPPDTIDVRNTAETSSTKVRSPKLEDVKLDPEPSDMEKRIAALSNVRKELEDKFDLVEKDNPMAVAEFNQLVDAYGKEVARLKKDYPILTLPPEVIAHNFNKSKFGEQPVHTIKEAGKDYLPGDEITDSEGADAFQKLVRIQNRNITPLEAEKQSDLRGTPIGRLAGSFGQGVISTGEGVAGFGQYVGDDLGISPLTTLSKNVGDKLNEWSRAIAPEDPNFAEQLMSGAGSYAVFLPFGIGVTSLAKAMLTVSPKLAFHLGTTGMTLAEAMMESGQVYRDTGNSIAAEKSFLANMILIGLTNRLGIRNEKIEKEIFRGLASSGLEGLQEGGQEIINSWSQGRDINWNDVIASTAIGGILGAGGAALTKEGLPEGKQKIGGDIAEQTKDLQSLEDLANETNKDTQQNLQKDTTAETRAKEKETTTGKGKIAQRNALQLNLMQRAGIPEEEMGDYALSSVADGKILGEYADDVLAGNITEDEAIERVKNDYAKMKSGQKEGKFIEPVKIEREGKTETNLSDAQKEAGNYEKEHVKVDGFDISVENKAGSIRSGKDARGREWQTRMNNDYGYIKGSIGKDKDHLDVFINNDKNYKSGEVFIVNQTKPDGSFDEHKIMLGFKSKESALQNYLSNYEKGWKNYADIVEMPLSVFKVWSKEPLLTKKPAVQLQTKENNYEATKRMYAEGKTAQQIAEALGTGINQVKQNINHIEGEKAYTKAVDQIRKAGIIKKGMTEKELFDLITKRELNSQAAIDVWNEVRNESEEQEQRPIPPNLPTPIAIMLGDINKGTKQFGKNVDDIYVRLEADKTRLDAIEGMAKNKEMVFKGANIIRTKRPSETELFINLADMVNIKGSQPIQQPDKVKIPTTKLSALNFTEVEMPVAKAVAETVKENPVSSGFHYSLNNKWTIVYKNPSKKLIKAAKDAGLKVAVRKTTAGFDVTDVTLEGVTDKEQDKAQKIFNKFADNYSQQPSELDSAIDDFVSSVKQPTQKEQVKEAVANEPKSIKQVAEETGILEPNVRRILGVGAKDGTFTRIDNGIYVLNVGGKDIAWIETGNALQSVPRLAKEGRKFDAIFLDIPYDTPAVKGGNRGVKYPLISLEQFKKFVPDLLKLTQDNNSAIYYMYSRAKSGWDEMQKYNRVMTDNGLIPIARGNYQKLYKSGKKVVNQTGNTQPPEGIILFSKSGKVKQGDLPVNLDFEYVRPKGYTSQKPFEMLEKMIRMTTKEGDIVLDPFAGSGSTIVGAVKSGRKGYGIEKQETAIKDHIIPNVEAAVTQKEFNPKRLYEKIVAELDAANDKKMFSPGQRGRARGEANKLAKTLRENGINAKIEKGSGDKWQLYIDNKAQNRNTLGLAERAETIKKEDVEIENKEATIPFDSMSQKDARKQTIAAEMVTADMLPSGIGKAALEKGMSDIKKDDGLEQSKEAQIVRDAAVDILKNGIDDVQPVSGGRDTRTNLSSEEVNQHIEQQIEEQQPKEPKELTDARNNVEGLKADVFASDKEIAAAEKVLRDLEAKYNQQKLEVKTPGTNITFSTVKQWIDGWNEINSRPASSRKNSQMDIHPQKLTKEIIDSETDIKTLQAAAKILKDQKPGRGERSDTEPITVTHQWVNNRIAQLEKLIKKPATKDHANFDDLLKNGTLAELKDYLRMLEHSQNPEPRRTKVKARINYLQTNQGKGQDMFAAAESEKQQDIFGQEEETPAKVTKELLAKAEQFGKEAFGSAAERNVTADIRFMDEMIKGRKVGEGSKELMEAWYKGWDKANLAAPVPETKLDAEEKTPDEKHTEYKELIASGVSPIEAATQVYGLKGETKADKLRKEADKLYEEARKMTEGIPPGQPIHSTRERNFLDKVKAKREKARELYKQADEWEKQQQKSTERKDKIKSIENDELKNALDDFLGSMDKLTSGIDPEQLAKGVKVIAVYTKLGTYKFADIVADLYAKMGEKVRDLMDALKAAYASYRETAPDDIYNQMDSSTRGIDLDQIIANLQTEDNDNVTTTNRDLEQDSRAGESENQLGEEDVSTGQQSDVSGSGEGRGSVGGTGLQQQSDTGLFGSETTSDGEGSDTGFYEQEPDARPDTDIPNPTGSSSTDGRGIPLESDRSELFTETVRDVSLEEKRELQKKADKIPVKLNDWENIQQTLPYLIPPQQDDVRKAEHRFFEQNGKGIMFTNATGTGKTYTGLGIAKRFYSRGKKNILIVVPTDRKVKDWIDEGKNVDLPITQLKSTVDKGKGAVATTYANFRANETLTEREFDLVIYDESHKIKENEAGDRTAAEIQHKYLTFSPNQALVRARENVVGKEPNINDYRTDPNRRATDDEWQQYREAHAVWEAKVKENAERIEKERQRLAEKTKVIFLSASPFAYKTSLDYADGYLYQIEEGLSPEERRSSGGYNAPDAREQFYVSNFGYRMRYNKLTIPESGVDVGLMERNFNEKLKKDGVLSARQLENPHQDYSREFVMVNSELANQINEAITMLHEERFRDVYDLYRRNHNYLNMARLLEGLKAESAIDRIKKHIALGRKIIIFHDYNEGSPQHPFYFGSPNAYEDPKLKEQLEQWYAEGYQDLPLYSLINPIAKLTAEFRKNENDLSIVFFNGNIPKKKRSEHLNRWNERGSGTDIIVVQRQAGKEGLNAHDIFGDTPRVLMDFGLPIRPTDSIQTEGRIVRWGAKSNAIIEYITFQLPFEQHLFGSKIKERSKTAENLAMGAAARNLELAFTEGYQNPVKIDPHEKQGTGTKAADRQFEDMTEFKKAKTYYYGRQKRTSRNKSREGIDYFATPEPLGLKMVEWVNSRPNDTLLEPSAGHGAIARFFPGNTTNQFIEPSLELRAELSLNADGNLHEGKFEDYYIGNKFDGIVMNPPFGHAGSTALEHLKKAYGHLRNGGRIVALVPTGAFDKKFENWFYGDDKEAPKDLHLRARILLPSVTFERAGTSVAGQILILDRVDIAMMKKYGYDFKGDLSQSNRDWTDKRTIEDLFEHIEDVGFTERPQLPSMQDLYNMSIKGTAASLQGDRGAQLPTQPQQTGTGIRATQDSEGNIKTGGMATVVPNFHAKKQKNIYVVKMLKRVDREQYEAFNARARNLGGYYSSYKGQGAIPGFVFENEEQARRLADFINSFGGSDNSITLSANPLPEILKGMDRAVTALDELWKKALGDKLFKKAGSIVKAITPERVKELLITNYGLPEGYTELKSQMIDGIAKYRQLALELGDLLRFKDPEKKIKYSNAEQIRLQQLIRGGLTKDPDLRAKADRVMQEIKQLEKLGKELGTLPIETYNSKLPRKRIAELLESKAKIVKQMQDALDKVKDVNVDETTGVDKAAERLRTKIAKGFNAKLGLIDRKIKNNFKHGGEGYFKRVYLNKEQAKKFKKYGYVRPTRLDLTSAIMRQDIPEEIRKEMGEVLTASYPVAKGIMLEGKDVSLASFFAAIDENPEWSISQEEYDAAPREDFVLMPNDYRLGRLAGKYVQEDIANDINDVLKFTEPDYIESFLKKINANWKATKTIMNPATHLRNIYSNTIMLDFSGVSHVNQARIIPEAIKMIKGKGKYAEDWKEARLSATTFEQEELGKYLDVIESDRSFVDLSLADKIVKLYGKASLVDTRIGDTLGKIYQYEELFGKAIKFISELEKGKTAPEAKAEANKWLFDYQSVPKLIRWMRTNPLLGMPFVTWSYKAFPRIIEAAITRPIAFWKYPVIFAAITKFALNALDLDDDEWEEIKATLPERMIKGQWLLLPFRDDNGKMQMLDLTYILPYKDVYDVIESGYTLATAGQFNSGDDISEGVMGLFQAPILKAVAEIMANKNTYTNQPIYFDLADSPTEKAGKVFDYMYKMFMPSLTPALPFLTQGGYAYDKLASVVMRKEDYYGRTFSLSAAISSSLFGLKTSPIEPVKNIERKEYQLQQQINELGMKRNRLLRDGALSPEERLAKAGEIDKQQDSIRQQIAALNVPDKNISVKELEKQIRSLQRKRSKLALNDKNRSNLSDQINELKIQLAGMTGVSEDIYEEERPKTEKPKTGSLFKRDSGNNQPKSLFVR